MRQEDFGQDEGDTVATDEDLARVLRVYWRNIFTSFRLHGAT